MEKETVLEILQSLFQLQSAQVDIRAMEMETVLLHGNQLSVTQDLLAMDQEAASQPLFQLYQLAQMDMSQMDKETVFQQLNH
jgi:hypothetical protein